MKRTIAIALMLMVSSICFGQKASKDSTAKIDSTALPLLSIRDMKELNVFLMGQFTISESKRYEAILREVNRLIDQADKRRKKK